MPSLAKFLTEQFYAWERRDRGWQMRPGTVAVEPAFEPFVRYPPVPHGGEDDGGLPPLWERLWKWWRFGRKTRQEPLSPHKSEAEPEEDDSDEEIVEIQVRLPAATEITGEFADHLLLAVASLGQKTSFELLAVDSGIVLQYAVPAP